MSSDSTPFFLRSAGRVTGPFTRGQLEELRLRGRFLAFHEISTNRILWTPAIEQFPDLFGGKSPEAVPAQSTTITARPVEETQWFYLDRSGGQNGPVPETQLRSLIQSGQVKANTKVWTSGMPAWEKANEAIADLKDSGDPAQPRTVQAVVKKEYAGFDPALAPRASRGLLLVGTGLCLFPFYTMFGIVGFSVLMGLGGKIRSSAQASLIFLAMTLVFGLTGLAGFLVALQVEEGRFAPPAALAALAVTTAVFLLHVHSALHTVSRISQATASSFWSQIAAVLQLVLILADLCIAGSITTLFLTADPDKAYLYGGLGSIGVFFLFMVLVGLVISSFSVRQSLSPGLPAAP